MDKTEHWTDKIFWHWIKGRKTLFVHIGNFEMAFGFTGFGWPRLEFFTSDGDYEYSLYVHLILFGFNINSSRFPFIPYRWFQTTRGTGFYSSKESFTLMFHCDTTGHGTGWRGWDFSMDWKRIFKGKVRYERYGEFQGVCTMVVQEDHPPVAIAIYNVVYAEHYTRAASKYNRDKWVARLTGADFASVSGTELPTLEEKEVYGVEIDLPSDWSEHLKETILKEWKDASRYPSYMTEFEKPE